MKEIDFSEKKEALNDEMLEFIKEGVKIAGGSADIHRMVGYVIVSPCGCESTKEICVDEVKLERGILRFHDANAFVEDDAWYTRYDILSCSMETVCSSIQQLLEVISSDEDFAEDKREEFTDFVENVLPGCSDRIDWSYFENLDTMENNLITQVRCWMEKQ